MHTHILNLVVTLVCSVVLTAGMLLTLSSSAVFLANCLDHWVLCYSTVLHCLISHLNLALTEEVCALTVHVHP